MSDAAGFPPGAREQIEATVAAAGRARAQAYAPYSGFAVGAAVLTGGEIFTGVNVENASSPVSMCAERNAVAAAIGAGARTIDALAIVTAGDRPTPPCGACRQVLSEFGTASIVVAQTEGGDRATWALADLLPAAFGPSDLGR
jgi:cytidine deaminase